MRIPSEQRFMHDWVIKQAEHKYSSLYKEVRTNPWGEHLCEFEGFFPDVILGSYGQVVQRPKPLSMRKEASTGKSSRLFLLSWSCWFPRS